MSMQRVECRLLIQTFAAVDNKLLECLTLRVSGFTRLEQRECQLQRRQLKLRHLAVIHPIAGTGLGQLFLRCRFQPPLLSGFVALEILHRVHVNIDDVQPASRRRAIRTGAFRVSRVQRVNRIQPDKSAAPFTDLLHHLAQVAKVTDAPVAIGAKSVKLDASAPQLLAGQQGIRFEAAFRRHNQPALPLLLTLCQRQLMIARWQFSRQGERFACAGTALLPAAVFAQQRPLILTAARQRQCHRRALIKHLHRRQRRHRRLLR
ncbi:hypothetical protein D3C71_1381420 [compost metagenome]